MAFQFQAEAALSPFLIDRHGIGPADIGLFIGLFLSSGILFALPGAAIGQRFGDERTVAFGLMLMLAGGLARPSSSPSACSFSAFFGVMAHHALRVGSAP